MYTQTQRSVYISQVCIFWHQSSISEQEQWFEVSSHISPSTGNFCLSPQCQIIVKATIQSWSIKDLLLCLYLALDQEPLAKGSGLMSAPPCMAALWTLWWEIDACSLCPFSLLTKSSIMFWSTSFDLAIQWCFAWQSLPTTWMSVKYKMQP